MLATSSDNRERSSTPKRRRLGMSRPMKPNLLIFNKENHVLRSPDPRPASPFDKNDDPPLPCNQIEYLCDSSNLSASSDIPCSPGILDNSVMKNMDKWESLVVSRDLTSKLNAGNVTLGCQNINEIEDISDEMFASRLEHECTEVDNRVGTTLRTSRSEKYFREHIEDCFDAVNQSIIELDKEPDINHQDTLLEIKDSFLLNVRDSYRELEGNIAEKNKKNDIIDLNNFYGLPSITRELFKTFRKIEKFYDWQEECLNLSAIKERRNLIYALPTSGGKTLVAEVLMLKEVLCRRKNALFILPFVAIVQEKIWALSPFALQLEFLVEEYAAGKGHIPPKKRRKKNSIYIATIEKGLALIRSLIEENRLDELGLIVVDELHLIGEPGRGAALEMLLTTVLFANKDIQIVGMSATIGNLPELASFLRAEVFERQFRPVELAEYVKLGDMLHRVRWTSDGMEVIPERQLVFDYSAAGATADPDRLGGLVAETVPGGACLVFCPTKRNCENVAALLCKLQRKEMLSHRTEERTTLSNSLRAEGAGVELVWSVRCGVAYHHAGLSADERVLLENAFRCGVISVLCCTSTLAAGVNLPARRVIIRAPRVGRDFLTLAAYRQMAGRAGRAGVCHTGESIIICDVQDWVQLRGVLRGGLGAARSVLASATHVHQLLLSAVALNLATQRNKLSSFLGYTLLANESDDSPMDTKQMCDDALRSLLHSGALEVYNKFPTSGDSDKHIIYNDSEFVVSKLGRAAIKGCMELSVAKQLLKDLQVASRSLVVMGSLHLLYLVTPHAGAGVKLDYAHYYSLYTNLDEEGVQTARVLGITEVNAIRMVTGKPITNVPEMVLSRFYVAMMLHDLWKQMSVPDVSYKYIVPRGTVQSLMTSSAAFASNAYKLCEELEHLWPFKALFGELAPRLQHCAAPELQQLMDLPAVKKARALQLMRGGFKKIEDIAKASVDDLTSAVTHLSRSAASHLISAARMMLIEKVENLRAEAEDVMEGLKI